MNGAVVEKARLLRARPRILFSCAFEPVLARFCAAGMRRSCETPSRQRHVVQSPCFSRHLRRGTGCGRAQGLYNGLGTFSSRGACLPGVLKPAGRKGLKQSVALPFSSGFKKTKEEGKNPMELSWFAMFFPSGSQGCGASFGAASRGRECFD